MPPPLAHPQDAPVSLDYLSLEKCGRLKLPGGAASAGEGPSALELYRLDSGLDLSLSDVLVPSSLRFDLRNIEACVGFGYCLRGRMELEDSGRMDGPRVIREGEMAWFSSPDFESYAEICHGRRISRISLSIPRSGLKDLSERYESLLGGLSGGLAGRLGEGAVKTFVPGPAVRKIAYDALECHYAGALRRLFMEGIAFELLAGCLSDIASGRAEGGRSQRNAPRIGPKERSQAELAARLLEEDFTSVPTLEEVARKTGLSRCALGPVFKSVHGMTPFAWLRAKRLEKAKEMLSEGSSSVTEAATAVGYNSLSHFAKAFAGRFDVHPSEICRSRRSLAASSPIRPRAPGLA